jgi:asparagine synthase (glutamine-hydrolysing)
VYNGELYNAHHLRTDLEKHGVRLRGHSDTEVLLHAWALEGPAILPKLRGMFAFCIWDATASRAFLCRDRFGMKPLYVAPLAEGILFASELRALMTCELLPRVLDENALAGYLATGAVPEPRTLLRDVFMLPAGSYVEIDADGSISSPNPYVIGALVPDSPAPTDCGAAARLVHDALADSVAQHMVSDVPLGIFLSGGIDSASVVALVAEQGTRPETFTVAFEQHQYDEGMIARSVAQRFGTRHHEILLRGKDVLRMLPEFFAASDHPSQDGLNTWCMSGAVHARDISVALSGLGGDEMFAGYPSFRRARRLRLVPKHRGLLRRVARHAPGRDDTKRAQLSEMFAHRDPALAAYIASRMMFSPRQVAQLLNTRDRSALSLYGIAPEPPVFDVTPQNRVLNRVSSLELAQYTRNTLLRDADVFSMAHSLELRVPFIDAQVAVAAGGAADACKLDRHRPKPLLLDAMGSRIPEQVWNRPKQGFVLPLQHWLQHELRDDVTASLDSAALRDAGLSTAQVHDTWAAFQRAPSARTTSRVWTLYALAQWLDRNGVTRA